MKKIGIVGHFGGNENFLDGQTVKTKNLYRALEEEFSSDEIEKLDTYGYKRNIFSFLLKTVMLIFKSKNLVMLPDENGVRVFVPLYRFLNFFLRRKLHYAVVGGWLPVFLKKHKFIRNCAKKLDGVYVETSSMKNALEELDFKNVQILPNFKYLNILDKSELVFNNSYPLRLCIFSRIMAEKGVEEVVETITVINNEMGKTVYELDMFGPIDPDYVERFTKLQKTFPDYIKYKGLVQSEKSVEVLKDYFALIFPTKFYTEGIPGTLIDALAAGVPVITSLWANYADIFKEGVTGWGFEFGDFNEFKKLLEKAAETPGEFSKMKITSLYEIKKFQPQRSINNLISRFR